MKSNFKILFLLRYLPISLFSLFLLTSCSSNSLYIKISEQNSDFNKQWGLYNYGQEINNKKGIAGVDINVLNAWEITKGSANVIVGVLDSGIDTDCIELKDSILVNKNEISQNNIDDDKNGFIDDITGWNFYHNSNKIFDNYLHDYHGTYLSGIIAASHTQGEICGIAPNIKILPLKFMHGSKGEVKDAIKAIEYAYKLGVRIINCSWDGTEYDQDLKNTMEKYYDILFLCSAGKNKNDLDKIPVYPACYDLPNVISVAAIDNQGNLYKYSGYGEKADVAAPGVDIYSCMPDRDYTYSSGTSAATAYVTGIAALVKSYKPFLNSVQIAKILKTSVNPISQLEGKVASAGIMDAYACLKSAEKYGDK